ncbi:MAG: sigma-70 family RNA polymerase sigma factor [Clostridia bacterium]|nr:sigma-70 family RNA polymerase sigma factor [Deltaproteobacteria bacterium]
MSAAAFELNTESKSAVTKKTAIKAIKSTSNREVRVIETRGSVKPTQAHRNHTVDNACVDLQWLVLREARRVARRLPYFTEIDDLIGAGAIGLVSAVQRHIDKPTPILQRFAQLRIRGAILDHLRTNDHLTRRQRAAVGQLRKQTERLTREGIVVDSNSLANALGMSASRVERIQHRLAAIHITHIEDTECVPVGSDDPDATTLQREIKLHIVAALATLPEKVQTLLSLYYYENLSYREIGEVLGVTDSRVCQLHTQAMQTLRRRLDHLR